VQLRKLHYTVDHVSVMVVEALSAPEPLEQIEKIFSRITTYHGIILVSINAAEQALPWLKKYPHARTTKILSVGKTTASYYNANHAHDSRVIYPRQDMSSEGLLAMYELQAEEVKGRRYLILRGAGGRELIAQTLKERGAHVDSCELYRRYLPEQHATALQQCLLKVDTIIINSGEALENLRALAKGSLPEALFEKTLVVPGERVAEAARKSGFRHIITAANATDEAVIEALTKAS
jgi:uroporphyrinogen-III synthase